jgi:hypothetical protein
VPQPKTEESGKGMGGKGIGAREEKAEEDRQNDGGKIIQTQIPPVLPFCRSSFCRESSLSSIPWHLFTRTSRFILAEKQDFEHV